VTQDKLLVVDVKLHRNGIRLILNRPEGRPGMIFYGRNFSDGLLPPNMSSEIRSVMYLVLSSMTALYVRVSDDSAQRSLELVVVASEARQIELLDGVIRLINAFRSELGEPVMSLPDITIPQLIAQGAGMNIALAAVASGLPAEVQRAVNAYLERV